MKKHILIFFSFFLTSLCFSQVRDTVEINKTLDKWHFSAARADFKAYFDLLHTESIFIGTDATERWDKREFMKYAKPHFDKGRAWNFKSLIRYVNFSADGQTAWVDELLDTQMKICRGSGILVLEEGKWFIKHYVLSMTIPNDIVETIVPLKVLQEDKIIEQIRSDK
ncbi:nuclear transport factor 2 family protein [Sphingobacterium lumbrici]|uniref:nuclear transport factor 2 family protein n=1 Tax=Sphingobacterium lumbrici TaxID=2559600 RepID=UPI00112C3EDC|nr:nuclear transport factor 2 family protein [Sphingobacterium lumbrici]